MRTTVLFIIIAFITTGLTAPLLSCASTPSETKAEVPSIDKFEEDRLAKARAFVQGITRCAEPQAHIFSTVTWGAPTYKPSRKLRIVKVGKRAIEIKEKVQFDVDAATIKPESFGLLDQVARAILAHPDIALVEVDGHADKTGSDARNRTLTRQRADAVRKHLIKLGIEPQRLRAIGLSSYCPLNPADTEQAYEQNRRVEFTIVVRYGEVLPPGWGGCAAAEKRGIRKPPTSTKTAKPKPVPSVDAPPPKAIKSCAFTYPPRGNDVKGGFVRVYDRAVGEPTFKEKKFARALKYWEARLCSIPSGSVARAYTIAEMGNKVFVFGSTTAFPDGHPRQVEFFQRGFDLIREGLRQLQAIADSSKGTKKIEAEEGVRTFKGLLCSDYRDLGMYEQALALCPDYKPNLRNLWRWAKVAPDRKQEFMKRIVEETKKLVSTRKKRDFCWGGEKLVLGGLARMELGQEEEALAIFKRFILDCECDNCECKLMSPYVIERLPKALRPKPAP